MNLRKRILVSIIAAILCSVIVPLAYYFAFSGFPSEGYKGVIMLMVIGLIVGALLGSLFPRCVGWMIDWILFD